MSDLQWGTVPDWVAAVGTAGAFIAGGVLIAKELSAQHKQDEDARRAQASLVSAWATLQTSSFTVPGGPTSKGTGAKVVIRNGSEQPIYNCGASLPSGQAFVPGLVPPETTVSDVLPYKPPPGTIPLRSVGGEIAITVTFRDSNGRMWKRGPEGILESFEHEHIFSTHDAEPG